jgi:hypothetical protein
MHVCVQATHTRVCVSGKSIAPMSCAAEARSMSGASGFSLAAAPPPCFSPVGTHSHFVRILYYSLSSSLEDVCSLRMLRVFNVRLQSPICLDTCQDHPITGTAPTPIDTRVCKTGGVPGTRIRKKNLFMYCLVNRDESRMDGDCALGATFWSTHTSGCTLTHTLWNACARPDGLDYLKWGVMKSAINSDSPIVLCPR